MTMLRVSGRSWHARVYRWWYRHKYNCSRETMEYTTQQSNLCPYMRAVLFYAPIRAIFWNWVGLFGLKIKGVEIAVNAITIPATIAVLPILLGYISYYAKVGLWLSYLLLMAIVVGAGAVIGIKTWVDTQAGQKVTGTVGEAISAQGGIRVRVSLR